MYVIRMSCIFFVTKYGLFDLCIFFDLCWFFSLCYMLMTESDNDGSGDESQQFWNLVLGAARLALVYYDRYLDKNAPRTSILSGMGWLQETLWTLGKSHSQLRMGTKIFMDFHELLVRRWTRTIREFEQL